MGAPIWHRPLSALVWDADHTPRFRALAHHLMAWSWEYGLLKDMTRREAALAADLAVLHDAGKHLLPPAILDKPGRLTGEERRLMQKHPVWGEALILYAMKTRRRVPALAYAAEICLHHHERWDGGGYPDGLRGRGIPMFVQAAGLADAYDALVSPRSYRPPMDHRTAAGVILAGGCGAFSPALLDILAERAQYIQSFIYEEAPNDKKTI